ncbi:hypothetical protein SYNPS1DRAFT_26736 [Syncephalis pseudoplumigaleata]|uniref:Uncharacterized protein n=1 Tax=Syncephalis pseudoplumigaleata TaxID=1712513 RepID=A0A4P9Z4V8_9FUNG|nr:hypothetical protein SYNPS1DRAFT_26736 [Syncephalis pseudoplumigaleata]|eukprot:RKP27623.1 hypothetical protein SYNPS1DRAFT_26736 [Syncephalis pseudoplumigaleata]
MLKCLVSSCFMRKYALLSAMLFGLLLVASLPAIEAAVEPYLVVADKSKYPVPAPVIATKPGNYSDIKVCAYAEGLESNRTVVNDSCGKRNWRPGQAWRFDKAFIGYQPVRIGHNLCMDIVQPVAKSMVKVNVCPEDSNRVEKRQLWRISCNQAEKCWFHNLLTNYCLTASYTEQEFFISECTQQSMDSPQLFIFQKPKNADFVVNLRGVVY